MIVSDVEEGVGDEKCNFSLFCLYHIILRPSFFFVLFSGKFYLVWRGVLAKRNGLVMEEPGVISSRLRRGEMLACLHG